MIGHNRIAPSMLTEKRLDSSYYASQFIANDEKLDECGLERIPIGKLSNLCNCGATPKQVVYSKSGIGLIRTSDVRPNEFKSEGVLKTSDLKKILRESLKALPNDMLYTMSGTIGYAAVIPDDRNIYSFSNTIARVRLPEKSTHDIRYIAAFFNCQYGYLQSRRLISGGIQGHVMPNPFKHLRVSLPNELAQKHIGNKVRQAETLKAWTKKLENRIFDYFKTLSQDPIKSKSSWRVNKTLLDSYRINPKHYDPVVINLIEKAKYNNIKLVKLVDLFGKRDVAGGATPKGASYPEKGIFFVRVQNVKPLRLDLSGAVFIDPFTDEELRRSRCIEKDIILSITGYPGTASMVEAEDLPVNINQHSVRFDILETLSPEYVCAAINSEFVAYQVKRLAIGGTRDALDYKSVKDLLIPILSNKVCGEIEQMVRWCNASSRISTLLVNAAKQLVEALIENKLTEQEFINAQQALERGDTTLDRQILGRLTTKGIDHEDSPPLFPNLDQLYELLEKAEEPLEVTP